jgi:hypothetical protein
MLSFCSGVDGRIGVVLLGQYARDFEQGLSWCGTCVGPETLAGKVLANMLYLIFVLEDLDLVTRDEVAYGLGQRPVVLDKCPKTECIDTRHGAEASYKENGMQGAPEAGVGDGEDLFIEEVLTPLEVDVFDVFKVRPAEDVVDGDISHLKALKWIPMAQTRVG